MKENINITRRGFLRVMGVGAATAAVAACSGKKEDKAASAPQSISSGEKATGEMTYRTNSVTGDKVSILGYGCMRFPKLSGGAKTEDGNDLDQEAINELIDYAMEHGVNYYDTSPAYCKGFSESALGIALKRHPRDKFYVATKLSNFAPGVWSREKSMKMYEDSFKNLQVDYIDYLLLHGIGMGGMEAWNGRYIDNGMLDHLVKEREKGRIRNLGFSYHGDVEVFDHLLEMQDKGEIKWDFAQIQLNYIDWLHAKEVNKRNTDAEYLYNELT